MEDPVEFVFGKKCRPKSIEEVNSEVLGIVEGVEEDEIALEYKWISKVIRKEMSRYTIGELIRYGI